MTEVERVHGEVLWSRQAGAERCWNKQSASVRAGGRCGHQQRLTTGQQQPHGHGGPRGPGGQPSTRMAGRGPTTESQGRQRGSLKQETQTNTNINKHKQTQTKQTQTGQTGRITALFNRHRLICSFN